MEILYSGTDKKLCDALEWMLIDSRVHLERRTHQYQGGPESTNGVFQILVDGQDWDRAARELESISGIRPNTGVESTHHRCYWCVFAIIGVLAIGLFGGFAAAQLLR